MSMTHRARVGSHRGHRSTAEPRYPPHDTQGHAAIRAADGATRYSSVVFDIAGSGVDLSQEVPDALDVLIQRAVRRRALTESVAWIRPGQPGVRGTAERVRPHGEYFGADF